MVAILVVLFAFVFTTLSGWFSQQPFEVDVQSALFGLLGRAAVGCRRRAKAEAIAAEAEDRGGSLDMFVKGVFVQQQQRSEDD